MSRKSQRNFLTPEQEEARNARISRAKQIHYARISKNYINRTAARAGIKFEENDPKTTLPVNQEPAND